MYEYVTTNPTIMYSYNAPIKNMKNRTLSFGNKAVIPKEITWQDI